MQINDQDIKALTKVCTINLPNSIISLMEISPNVTSVVEPLLILCGVPLINTTMK